MKNKVLYILIGLILFLGLSFTTFDNIDPKTLDLINDSFNVNTENIWKGYNLEKYPMDVNYGDKEFRFFNGILVRKNLTSKF